MNLSIGTAFTAIAIFLAPALCRTASAQAAPPKIPVAEITAEQEQELIEHVRKHHKSAADFVVGQFRDHDVVLLGEMHHVAENCDFVSSLIQPLYHSGIRILFTEFTPSRLNGQLESLVTAEEFDEPVALQLFRDSAWPIWGFQEYLGILRSAWELNKGLADDAPKFQVVGVDSDWTMYEQWFGGLSKMELMQQRLDREKHMGKVIRENCLEQKCKGLVHIGSAHTNTKHGLRLGKVLTQEYGSRIKQVYLHQVWPTKEGLAPIAGLIERIATEAGDSKPIGFEIAGTPLDRLSDNSVLYWQVLPDASLGDFAQSYVVLKPLAKLHRVKWIPGFITDETYEKAKGIAARSRWVRPEHAEDAKELDDAMQQVFSGALVK